MTFGVKSYIFRKRDGFPFKVVNLRKNIEKRVLYAVLEKNKYIVEKNKDESIKIGNLCNFREKNVVEIRNVFFFIFFPQQMKI